MKALLDTHTFLWWIAEPARLSASVREIIADGANRILFSAVSAWEIAIKTGTGRLRFTSDPDILIPREIATHGFEVLDIGLAHALRVRSLPAHHRDPFDRLLIAQAQIEKAPILSRDGEFGPYDVDVVW